jgi:hypothetical protein
MPFAGSHQSSLPDDRANYTIPLIPGAIISQEHFGNTSTLSSCGMTQPAECGLIDPSLNLAQ